MLALRLVLQQLLPLKIGKRWWVQLLKNLKVIAFDTYLLYLVSLTSIIKLV